MNPLCRTFVKLLSPPSTRNGVLPPLLASLDQSSSSSLLFYFTVGAPTRKYSNSVQKSSSFSSVSVTESGAVKGAPTSDWPRPSEIPWQAKVCNSVNLIGKVHTPVQFHQSSDGKCSAFTVITQEGDAATRSPALWIPITFEGNLAYIAACHLKENDCVYIAGQLINDPSPLNINEEVSSSFQVMVHSVNFVEQSGKKERSACENEEKSASNQSGNSYANKVSLWRDLLMNPKQWRDNRQDKLNRLVNPKFPDFKRKSDLVPLWLDSAPEWVFLQLEGLEFDDTNPKTKYLRRNTEELWKDLVENPDKWWDNRSSKAKEKSPDFKHKDTGEAIWLSSAPDWALPKLPPMKTKEELTFTSRETLLS